MSIFMRIFTEKIREIKEWNKLMQSKLKSYKSLGKS